MLTVVLLRFRLPGVGLFSAIAPLFPALPLRPVEGAAGGEGTVGLAASPCFSGVSHVTCKWHCRTLVGYYRIPLPEHKGSYS